MSRAILIIRIGTLTLVGPTLISRANSLVDLPSLVGLPLLVEVLLYYQGYPFSRATLTLLGLPIHSVVLLLLFDVAMLSYPHH